MKRTKSDIIGSLLAPTNPNDRLGRLKDKRSPVERRLQKERQKPIGLLKEELDRRDAYEPPSVEFSGSSLPTGPGDGEGMSEATFNSQLQKMIKDAPGKISITSGKRDRAKQEQLWEDALEKYGDPEIADNWVARPGTSKHETGLAADLSFADDATKQWFHQNAEKYGLYFPMSHEPWHIQLQKGYTAPQPVEAPSTSGGKNTTGNPYIDYIIEHESNFDPHAQNPTSSAFGIGQMIKANRVAYGKKFGFDPNTTNPNEQITMMKAYIQDRYGSPEAAYRFKKQHGWY